MLPDHIHYLANHRMWVNKPASPTRNGILVRAVFKELRFAFIRQSGNIPVVIRAFVAARRWAQGGSSPAYLKPDRLFL